MSILTVSRVLLASLLLLGSCDAIPLHKYTHLIRRHSHVHAPKQVEQPEKRQTVSYGMGMKVTNNMAYWGNTNMNDGSNYAVDAYKPYNGPASVFPKKSDWISFDAMFNANIPLMKQSCGWNNWGPDNTDHLIGYIKNYIQQVALASRVDHRAILAVIMQESGGCLCVPTTNNGVVNPGIMQSHNGVAFDSARPVTTIRQMIIDGTMGTAYGDGLVQLLNTYGDYYSAFRAYNSGSVIASDLSNGNGATPCYVSDIANRLTGWTLAPNGCTA